MSNMASTDASTSPAPAARKRARRRRKEQKLTAASKAAPATLVPSIVQIALPNDEEKTIQRSMAILRKLQQHVHEITVDIARHRRLAKWDWHCDESRIVPSRGPDVNEGVWIDKSLRFRFPADIELSYRYESGLLSLRLELLHQIMKEVQKHDDITTGINACVQICKSMSAACDGQPILRATLRNGFGADGKRRYCGGCHKWRLNNFDQDVDASSARFWLHLTVFGHVLGPSVWPWRPCVGNSLLVRTYGVKSAGGRELVYRQFCADWKAETAWPTDLLTCGRKDTHTAPKLSWCPSCRAQKLFEDDALYKLCHHAASLTQRRKGEIPLPRFMSKRSLNEAQQRSQVLKRFAWIFKLKDTDRQQIQEPPLVDASASAARQYVSCWDVYRMLVSATVLVGLLAGVLQLFI